jgi:hypothetical protein
MLEEIQAIGLVGLVVAHYFLIRGCFGIRESIPVQSGVISMKIDRTADLLDEMAQIIADFADGVQPTSGPPAQAMSGWPALLSTMLMRNQAQGLEHAETQTEWAISTESPPNKNEA